MGRPKKIWALVLLVPTLFVLLIAVKEESGFYSKSAKVVGSIVDVEAKNDWCRGLAKFSSHTCTRFYPVVSFQASEGQTHRMTGLESRNEREHDRPKTESGIEIGSPIEVRFDPADPTSAVENRFLVLWGKAVFLVLLSIALTLVLFGLIRIPRIRK